MAFAKSFILLRTSFICFKRHDGFMILISFFIKPNRLKTYFLIQNHFQRPYLLRYWSICWQLQVDRIFEGIPLYLITHSGPSDSVFLIPLSQICSLFFLSIPRQTAVVIILAFLQDWITAFFGAREEQHFDLA